MVENRILYVCVKESVRHIFRNGERGGNDDKGLSSLAVSPQNYEIFDFHTIDSPVFAGWWWKVECCMLGYRKACCCTFDSYSALKQTIRPQEWLCHSRLRMVQSLQITGVKRNVLFLQKVRMQKLINGSMRNVSRSGEKGRTASLWLVGESRIHYVNQKE